MTISYKEMMRHKSLSHYSHSHNPKDIGKDGDKKMEQTEISWESALAGSGKYVKLEEGKRVVLVAKNARFAEVEKSFSGQDAKLMAELTLDVVEEEGVECDKTLNTVSKRFLAGLRPLFENVAKDVEVRFSVKKIGKNTDTAYDVESLQ